MKRSSLRKEGRPRGRPSFRAALPLSAKLARAGGNRWSLRGKLMGRLRRPLPSGPSARLPYAGPLRAPHPQGDSFYGERVTRKPGKGGLPPFPIPPPGASPGTPPGEYPWTPNFRRRSFSAGKDRFFPCSLRKLHAIRPGAVPGANILLTWNCIHTPGWPPSHAYLGENLSAGRNGDAKSGRAQAFCRFPLRG